MRRDDQTPTVRYLSTDAIGTIDTHVRTDTGFPNTDPSRTHDFYPASSASSGCSLGDRPFSFVFRTPPASSTFSPPAETLSDRDSGQRVLSRPNTSNGRSDDRKRPRLSSERFDTSASRSVPPRDWQTYTHPLLLTGGDARFQVHGRRRTALSTSRSTTRGNRVGDQALRF